MYVATGYKWLLAGFGISVIITGRHFHEQARPTLLSYGNAPPATGLVYGHRNLYGIYALGAAARLRCRFGLEAIRSRTAQLSDRLVGGLSALDLAPVARHGTRAGIISLAIRDPDAAVTHFRGAGVMVASRSGLLRLSPCFYTDEPEVDHALNVLEDGLRSNRLHLQDHQEAQP